MADSEQYYSGTLTLSDDYADNQLEFGFECNHIIIANDGTGVLSFSWTGQTGTNDGDISPADKSIAMDGLEKSKVFLKASIAGPARVWAWKGQS